MTLRMGRMNQLQFPCHARIRWLPQNVVEAQNEFNMATKTRRMTKEDDIKDHIAKTKEGHTGFTNEIFANVGGGTFARAALCGGTSIGAHGSSAFHSPGRAPASSQFEEAVAAAQLTSPASAKKIKERNARVERLKVSQELKGKADVVEKKLKA